MSNLIEIDNDLISQVDAVRKLATQMNFSHICDFNLTPESIATIPWNDVKHPGIYYIQIRNCRTYIDIESWSLNFQTKWMDERYRRKFVANPKKSTPWQW